MLGRYRCSEGFIFTLMRHETTPPSRLRGFPGIRNHSLQNIGLKIVGNVVGRMGEAVPTQNLQKDLSGGRATSKHLGF